MTRPPDEATLLRIYRETLDELYGFVSRRCGGDRALAEDVTQETWLRAVRTWREDGLPDRPLAWLTAVSRNLLGNHARRRALDARHVEIDEQLDGANDTTMDDPPSDDEGPSTDRRLSLLDRALARLSAPQRQLLHAFHFDRQRVGDIARTDHVSARAIEGRLRRARQQLRHHIESDLRNGEDIT